MYFFRSYRAKLQAIFLFLGLSAIALTDWQASAGATEALRQATYDRLTAIRQSRVRQVERYFRDLGAHVLALSSDDSVLRALNEFKAAWTSLAEAQPGGTEEAGLRAYYHAFGEPAIDWLPRDRRAVTLQHQFLSANPHPVGAKDRLLEAPGAYGRAHARYHPTLHRYQSAFGFYDILLVDADARVLYTLFKEPDLGVSLRESPYHESPLGEIFRRAMQLVEPEQFVLGDYKPYVPSHSAPAAFAAAPIWRAGAKIGILAIQVPIREINRVMTADGNSSAEGLGRTGQTYIVGPDNKLRSDMRFRIEQPERYFEELLRAGTPLEVVDQVRRQGTAILHLRAAPEAERYRNMPAGTEIGIDARGVPVLRSHAPLNVPGMDWAVMAEIEADEAFAPVRALRNRILGTGAAIAAAFLIAAALLARSVTRPVLALAQGAEELGSRNFHVRLPVTSDDEIGQLAISFNRMAEDLERTTVSKEEYRMLADRLITAQEDERSRVARELHDHLSQRLAAVAIEAGNLEHASTGETALGRAGLNRIKQSIARLSDDVHQLSRSLHPTILDDLGLVAGIESECRAFFDRGGPPVEFVAECGPERLSRDAQLAFYRIVQEALHNIQKHAGAQTVCIRLDCGAEQAHLSIEDDGRGFGRDDPSWRAGLGLASIQERARLLGGHASIRSSPGSGTTIEVWVPAACASHV